jgi:hypothetical protein
MTEIQMTKTSLENWDIKILNLFRASVRGLRRVSDSVGDLGFRI